MMLTAVFAATACGSTVETEPTDGPNDCVLCGADRADALGLTAYEEAAVLDLVNTVSRRALDEDVALDRRAANNIVDARPIGDLEQLDAVAWVGKTAFKRLRNYVVDHDLVGSCGDDVLQTTVEACDDGNTSGGDGCSSRCQVEAGVTVHGVAEGSWDAMFILEIANEATFEDLDVDARLDRRAAENIVANRPFGSLTQLDRVPYVGATVFDRLLNYTPGDQCTTGELDELIVDVNSASYSVTSTREIRTDRSLEWALDERNWPDDLTHAGCYGVSPANLPSWIPITRAEDNTRLIALLDAFAAAAELRGQSTNIDAARQEVACSTAQTTFVGCRFEFAPDDYSGEFWNIVSADDGSLDLLFVGTWSE